MARTFISVATLATVAAVVTVAACSGPSLPSLGVDQEALTTPAGPGSGEPFLSSDGSEVYLSWLEAVDGGDDHELRFSRLEEGGWSEPRIIERSDLFFVNWADFPSMTPGPDGTLWAHWLERGGQGTYDYGVRIVRSEDEGETWSEPMTPHDDASPTEHGFVSTAVFEDGMGFVWLDGRRYAPGPGGTQATNEMTLRYRFASADGTLDEETLVDGRVCDCCQTSSAMTAEGPVVVYRDRTDDEIRDVYVTRLREGGWTEGAPVYADGWEIGGCPVNGPAVVARGMDVAVAWFTAAGDVPRVKVAFSTDAGATFGSPVPVDDGNPAGRVDLLMRDDGSVLVSWLERTGGEDAEIRLRRVRPDGRISASTSLVGSSSGRASGFPRLVSTPGGDVVLAWTDLREDEPQVRVAKLTVRDVSPEEETR